MGALTCGVAGRGKMDVALDHAGESHGRALVAVVEGMVAGVHVTSADSPTSWPDAGWATAAAHG
ncbi:chorismate synthase [Mycobacterium tuberculosis CAS/NITR204]|uniref:Chorismate synthase n=1 Tax=Mycobacterium tuberculosis CAS/NITR204 TaxID=1310114 RepID=R4MKK2_MYCTX|nr:chorismate synthase [Mycobacterium tuberculosis CAS/NITR204]